MWFVSDEFHFVWKKMNGDFILRTRVKFIGKGAVEHRKVGWMVRSKNVSRMHRMRISRNMATALLRSTVSPGEGNQHRALSCQLPTLTFCNSSGVTGSSFFRRRITANLSSALN